MPKEINLVFPHQLFEESPLLDNDHPTFLIEEFLFFNQFRFHKQKIAFHRASMKAYAGFLSQKGKHVNYIEASDPKSDIRFFLKQLEEVETIHFIDPTDYWLSKRINQFSKEKNLVEYENPLFLNTKKDNEAFFRTDKKLFLQATFYKQQRKKYEVLMEDDGSPVGGKWSFDAENRKKYPKGKVPPHVEPLEENEYWKEAVAYVEEFFPNNPGSIHGERRYPIDHRESGRWFDSFLHHRFFEFGDYEDAIVSKQPILHHSLLSPLLNAGLISTEKVLKKSVDFSVKHQIPINSTEGFVRQILGWREFIRGMYEVNGSHARTHNHWGFTRSIPQSFYTGETGILPLDETIKQVLETGYCHHIERLMILGNFMLLCEFDPNQVYQWFMELFIDAYDWVMVPNVYGMSQFADGGSFATKPYISGSNYLKKMSNFSKGPWQEIWDGLFWRFMDVHRLTFKNNQRMSMLLSTFDRMGQDKRLAHLNNAEQFLVRL